MSYAIIGTGNIGSALARLFARKGIEVAIANSRGPDSIAPLLKQLGGTITALPLQDALKADVVLLAIPFPAFQSFARTAAEWNGKIVVDAMNAREDLGGRMSSEMVAEALPGARVVKAFNQLPAALLARDPSQDGGRRVVFVSSNDEDASTAVQGLAEQLGFAPIALGRLDEGGKLLQFRAPLVLHNLVEHGLK